MEALALCGTADVGGETLALLRQLAEVRPRRNLCAFECSENKKMKNSFLSVTSHIVSHSKCHNPVAAAPHVKVISGQVGNKKITPAGPPARPPPYAVMRRQNMALADMSLRAAE